MSTKTISRIRSSLNYVDPRLIELEVLFRRLFKVVSIVALLGITIVINANVFSRFVLSNSIPWAESISTLFNTWVAFIGGAVALYVGDHVRVKFLTQRLSNEQKWITTTIINFLTVVMGSMMVWYGTTLAIDQMGNQSVNINISHFWMWIPISFCGIYLIIESGHRLLTALLDSLANGDSRPTIMSAVLSIVFLSFLQIGFVLPNSTLLELAVIFGILIALILIGMPIAFSMVLSILLFLIMFESSLEILYPMVVIQEMGQGLQGFSILAIPMFIYAGRIMSATGITSKIVDFANLLVGRMRAGLSHVNVVSSMLFAGISGSAVADTAAIGSILIPAMEDEGYSTGYSCGITCASAIIGPIIPPSIIMIIYAITVPEVGVSELFMAGIVPGILFGSALIGMTYVYGNISDWESYPKVEETEPPTGKEAFLVVRNAILALVMPLIILGGILSGVFTATEAGAVAVGYALLIGVFVYGEMSMRDFITASYQSATVSGVTLLIIAAAMPITQVMAIKKVPALFSDTLLSVSQTPIIILLLIVGFMSILALFIEEIANIILWGPVLSPLAVDVGIDPLHFAIIMIMTLAIGMITPPLGVTLFVAAPIGNTDIETITKSILPFLIAEVVILLLIIFVPDISLVIPRMLGY